MSRFPGSPLGVPLLWQPPPSKQMEWLCMTGVSTWFSTMVGLPVSASVTCAKKTCQSLLRVFGEVAVEPSQVTSTIPGLPATIHGITALLLAVSTCTAVVQVGEAAAGLAVLVRKTWQFV